MKAIITIDPSHPNITLTKTTGGLFVWSDWTLSQLKKGLNSGKSLHQRQIKLVILMDALLLHLMQDGAAISLSLDRHYANFCQTPILFCRFH